MSVPSRDAFARRFRAQSPAERLAFVVALFAASGWETTLDDAVVHARRDGVTRRVLVAGVGRPSPSQRSIDEIVAADTAAFQALARRSNARFVGPDDLRNWLLYGLDREAAAAVYREQFGLELMEADETQLSGSFTDAEIARSLPDPTALSDDAGDRLGEDQCIDGEGRDEPLSPWIGRVSGLRRRLDSVRTWDPRRTVAVGVTLLVLLVVVAVAFGGPPPIAEDSSAVVDVAAVDTAGLKPGTWAALAESDARLVGPPPGLSDDAVVDLDSLVAAHVAVAQRQPSSTVVTVRGPRLGTSLDARQSVFEVVETHVELHVDSDRHYRAVRRTTVAGPGQETTTEVFEAYGDEAGEYRRRVFDGETTDSHVAPTARQSGSDRLARLSRSVLEVSLNTTESRVERVTTNGSIRYRITAVGEPVRVTGETNDYRATAVVTPEGLVTDLRVRYRHPSTGTTVRIDFASHERDETTVSPPEWLDAARNETDRRSEGRSTTGSLGWDRRPSGGSGSGSGERHGIHLEERHLVALVP